MSETARDRLPVVTHILAFALSLLGAWAWLSVDYCGERPYPLWIPALAIWLGQSVFWSGFVSSDLKLLLLLAASWVGVGATLAVFALFIGMGVAATGEVTPIRIAIGGILLVPVLLLPRVKLLWPGARRPQHAAAYVARALFVVLQYGGIGLLLASLIRLCPPAAGQ